MAIKIPTKIPMEEVVVTARQQQDVDRFFDQFGGTGRGSTGGTRSIEDIHAEDARGGLASTGGGEKLDINGNPIPAGAQTVVDADGNIHVVAESIPQRDGSNVLVSADGTNLTALQGQADRIKAINDITTQREADAAADAGQGFFEGLFDDVGDSLLDFGSNAANALGGPLGGVAFDAIRDRLGFGGEPTEFESVVGQGATDLFGTPISFNQTGSSTGVFDFGNPPPVGGSPDGGGALGGGNSLPSISGDPNAPIGSGTSIDFSGAGDLFTPGFDFDAGTIVPDSGFPSPVAGVNTPATASPQDSPSQDQINDLLDFINNQGVQSPVVTPPSVVQPPVATQPPAVVQPPAGVPSTGGGVGVGSGTGTSTGSGAGAGTGGGTGVGPGTSPVVSTPPPVVVPPFSLPGVTGAGLGDALNRNTEITPELDQLAVLQPKTLGFRPDFVNSQTPLTIESLLGMQGEPTPTSITSLLGNQ